MNTAKRFRHIARDGNLIPHLEGMCALKTEFFRQVIEWNVWTTFTASIRSSTNVRLILKCFYRAVEEVW